MKKLFLPKTLNVALTSANDNVQVQPLERIQIFFRMIAHKIIWMKFYAIT